MRNLGLRSEKFSTDQSSKKKESWANLKENQSFCVNLFGQLATNNQGYYVPCCQFEGILEDEQGERYHAKNHSPHEFLNSKAMQSFRKKTLAKEQVDGCRYCYKAEAHGMKSMRMRDNESHRLRNRTINVSIEQTEMHSFDMRWGNLCNLGCVMCSPGASSFLDSEWSRNGGGREFSPYLLTLPEEEVPKEYYAWFKQESHRKELEPLSENLQRLMIVGGEPLINKQNLDFLETVSKNGRKLEIEISSNLTILNSRMIELLEKHNTIMKCSIDGTDVVYEYIRYPGKFKTVEQNLIEFAKTDIDLEVVFSTSILNLFNIPQFFKWIKHINAETSKRIDWSVSNIVYDPPHLNIENLPRNIKDDAIKMLESVRMEDDIFFKRKEKSSIVNLINVLEGDFGDVGMLQKNWKYLEKFDQVRKTDWKKIVPWMSEIIDGK